MTIKIVGVWVAVFAAAWLVIGLLQWQFCPTDEFPWRRTSLLRGDSCEVEVRPGKWVAPSKARTFKELCQ